MVLNAPRSGARSYVLRLEEILEDLQGEFWNDNEYVLSTIRCALFMKALSALNENCAWIPVDTLAITILEFSKTLQSPKVLCYRCHESSCGLQYVQPTLVLVRPIARESAESRSRVRDSAVWRLDAAPAE